MPLGVPNPNPTTAPKPKPKTGGGPSSGGSPTGGVPAPSPFEVKPVFGADTTGSPAWQEDVHRSGPGSYATNVIMDSSSYWGGPTNRDTQQQTYTQSHGQDAVNRAMASGLDPEVYFNENLTDKARGIIDQWGVNLPQGGDEYDRQQAEYAQQQDRYARDDNFMEQFDASNAAGQTERDNSFANQSANAQARYNLGYDELSSGYHIDKGLLGERKFRDVDLERSNLGIDQEYLGRMRGITDQREGIRGDQYNEDNKFFHQNWGELQTQKGTAYDRFMENDSYMAQQGVDNAKQYGFTGRQYDQNVNDAFSQRATQQRQNVSASAAGGSMSSAGFGDNQQDIMGQYGSAVDSAGLSLDRQNQQTDEQDRGIGHSRNLNDLGYEDAQSAFRGQENSLQHGLNQAGNAYRQDQTGFAATRAGYDKQGNRLENVGKGLDSLAKEYGLKEADIENQFHSAVTAAGLDLTEVNQRLERELASGNAESVSRANQFMYQMMSMQ